MCDNTPQNQTTIPKSQTALAEGNITLAECTETMWKRYHSV